jgi:hypothetical protein
MNNSDERDYAEETANRAAMRDDDDEPEVSMPAPGGGWLSGPCTPAPEQQPELDSALVKGLRDFMKHATLEQLAEMGGRIVAGMTGDWDCAAYGPEGRAIGARCFFTGEFGTRACLSRHVCEAALSEERVRVHARIHELAAANPDDGIWAHLAEQFPEPEQLLQGETPGFGAGLGAWVRGWRIRGT